MGPLEMVLAKEDLCSAVERCLGEERAAGRVQSLLRAGTHEELEARYKTVGLELMERGKKAAAMELVAIWRKHDPGASSLASGPVKKHYSLEDDDEDDAVVAPSLAQGFAIGFGKAFSRDRQSTTDQIAALATGDHAGAVTEWQAESEGSAARRLLGTGKLGLELAKAELVAVVKSKLGIKAAKIVDKMQKSENESDLELAIGEAQRKLVKGAMPRLAAKLAKKWLEFKGRVE